eukprot:1230040-Alexandrium_andersonii.AAC.1
MRWSQKTVTGSRSFGAAVSSARPTDLLTAAPGTSIVASFERRHLTSLFAAGVVAAPQVPRGSTFPMAKATL